jgi:GxxExxY protein
MKHEDLTEKIIGAAIEVHKHLGPGMLESAYEECLAYELKEKGLKIDRQKPVSIHYKKISLDYGYKIDLLVEEKVIVELKSVDSFTSVHEAQILTYMKFANKEVGLLVNFNVTVLKNGIKRYVL